jgi:predicted 3-demethylubiquinone-9 3-methyltransferase (glyoxalase superfamily)
MTQQKITPHLWFDTQAREAAELYTRVFPNSRIKHSTTLEDTPSGSVETLVVELMGQEFTLFSAGPQFKFTPAISFMITTESKAEVDRLYGALAQGGEALMELSEYPFSERYAWVMDRYGVSWQIGYFGEPNAQPLFPSIMFVGDVCGKAEEAMRLYTSLFPDAKLGDITRYSAGDAPEVEGTIMYADFTLAGQAFAAMDSAQMHDFTFTEAISLVVHCEDQAEIDRYWDALSAVPEAEACGWLKDKYGVSWQIVPKAMNEMMASGDPEKIARVTQAFLPMKKLDLATLQRAYEGVAF